MILNYLFAFVEDNIDLSDAAKEKDMAQTTHAGGLYPNGDRPSKKYCVKVLVLGRFLHHSGTYQNAEGVH